MKWLWLGMFLCAACGDDGNSGTRDDAGVDAPDPDLAAPSVVSVTPVADTAGVTTTTPITVTFSEAMDPATLASAITLTPATAASVTWDEPSLTATLVPSTPLHRAAEYTIGVSTAATDTAGNALAAAYASPFTVEVAPPVRIDTGGKAIPRAPAVTYDAAGNGVAAWLSEPDGDLRDVYYATYTAANTTWSPEMKLRSNLSAEAAFSLASNGTLIMLVVSARNTAVTAHAFRYDTPSTTWDIAAPVELASDGFDVRIVSNGTTFCAAWSDTDVEGALHDGTSTWGASTSLSTGTGEQLGSVRVATDGDAYAVGWIQRPASTYVPYLRVYEASTWKAAASTAEAGVTGRAESLEVIGAADGSGFLAVWTQDPPTLANEIIYAARWLRTGVDGTLQTAERLSPTNVTAYTPKAAAGANGSYGVTWQSSGDSIHFAAWSGSAWGAPEQVTAASGQYSTPLIARVGPRYAVVWLRDSDGYLFGRIRNAGVWESEQLLSTVATRTGNYALSANNGFGVVHVDQPATGVATLVRTLYAGGAWGVNTTLSTATVGLGDPFIAPAVTNNFVSAWMQDGTVIVRAGANNASLVATPPPSNALRVSAVGSAGRTLVTWLQGNGVTRAMFASVFLPASGWSAPLNLHEDDNYFETSTREGTFTIAHRFRARYFDGTWSDVAAPAAGFEYYMAAANADEHMLTHVEFDEGQTVGYFYRTTNDGTWSASAALPYQDSSASPLRLVASTHGFMHVYEYGNMLYAVRFDGTAWSAPELVTTTFEGVGAVSNGSHYAIAWIAFDSGQSTYRMFGSVFDGAGWSIPADLGAAGATDRLVITSNGSGYAVLWGNDALNAAVFAGTWSATDALSVDEVSTWDVASDGTGYLATWSEGGALLYRRWDGTWSDAVSAPRSGPWSVAARPGSYRVSSGKLVASTIELHAYDVEATGPGPVQVLDSAMSNDGDPHPMVWNGYSFAAAWARPAVANDPFVFGIYGTGAF